MATSKAQVKAVRKWEAENYWRAVVRLPKDYEERIRATGKSTNGFLREAVDLLLSQYEKNDNI